jgi:hypothetical protein
MSRRLASAARWSVLGIAMALSACDEKEPNPGNGTNNPGTQNPTAGTITGKALDTQGNPLANAKVSVEPALTKGDPLVTRTGADGTYRFEGLPSVPYWVHAWTEVNFNNQRFCLRLGMPDAAQYEAVNPSNGAVRDFRWQLSGVIPDTASDPRYFGGKIHLDLTGSFTGSTVALTFTPTSPLIDGRAASPVTRTVSIASGTRPLIEDLPVANYTVRGTVTQSGTEQPLRIGLRPSGSYAGQTETAELAFKPGGNPCISLVNGVEDAYLFLNRPE